MARLRREQRPALFSRSSLGRSSQEEQCTSNSPGGSLIEAMKLGEAIRAAGLETAIGTRPKNETERGSPGICASACTLAYLGGNFRYMGDQSIYAVHRFYYERPIQNEGDVAQVLSGMIVHYLEKMDVDPGFFQLMTIAGHDEVYVVPHDMLRKMKVVTGSIKSTTWTVENHDGLLYLRVVQVESRGTNKLAFVCDPQEGFMAIGFFNTSWGGQIVREALHKGWMFDGNFIDMQPGELVFGPVAKNAYVDMGVHVSALRLSQILGAKLFGLATQSSNRDLFSGFEIRMDDQGRAQLSSFAQACHH